MIKVRGSWGAAAILSALAYVLPGTAGADPVLFVSDFESGVLNDAATQQPSQGWQRAGTMPTIASAYARRGRFSAKAYLNKNSSSTPYRAMLQTAWHTTSDLGNRTSPHAPFFEDSWIGFSLYLPEGGAGATWKQVSTNYDVLVQWHDSHDPYPPPGWDTEQSKNPLFSLQVSDKGHQPALHWRVVYLGDSRTPYPTLNSPRPYQYETNASFDLGAIEPDLGKWTDFVVRIRWNFWKVGSRNNSAYWDAPVRDNVEGSPNSGLIQVWKNGQLLINRSPVQIGTNDNAGPVLSAGIYKGWTDASARNGDSVVDRALYFDEFKYGGPNAQYADVAPGGAGATPETTPKPPTNLTVDR
jgi:hypothetical protein